MNQIKFITKIALTFLGILIVVEILFRVVGFALMKPQSEWNKLRPDDDQKIRILALGESTTAEYFSDENAGGSWPRMLEKRLKAAGLPVRMYNEGVGGTSSPFLVGNLPEYLDRYRPHIVITMMGVNDVPTIWLDESFFSKFKLELMQFRVVKLVNWISEAIESKSKCKIEEYQRDWPRFLKFVEQGLQLQKKHSPQEVRDFLRKEIVNDKELASVLSEISIRLRGDFSNEIDYKPPQEYINLAFEIDPYEYHVAFWKMNRATPQMCKEATEKLLPCGSNIPDAILSEIVVCAGNDPTVLNHPVIRKRGMMMAPSEKTPTMHHYKLMIDILNHHDVKLVAMQYPTLSLDSLKQIITQNGAYPENLNGVTLVSNEKNFEEALKKNKFDRIFKDRFRGSWGHTTQLGHDIIADNLFPTIQQMILSGCCNYIPK